VVGRDARRAGVPLRRSRSVDAIFPHDVKRSAARPDFGPAAPHPTLARLPSVRSAARRDQPLASPRPTSPQRHRGVPCANATADYPGVRALGSSHAPRPTGRRSR
jgi:hypothetical protein